MNPFKEFFAGLSQEDIKALQAKGVDKEGLRELFKKFHSPTPKIQLLDSPSAEFGLHKISGPDGEIFAELYENFLPTHTIGKFILDSPEGNRLFSKLSLLNSAYEQIDRRMLGVNDPYSERNLKWFHEFIDNIQVYPFFLTLKSQVKSKGFSLEKLLEKGEYKEILRLLLDPEGMGYSDFPTSLIKCRTYPEFGEVSFLEEHLLRDLPFLLHQGGKIRIWVSSANRYYSEVKNHIESVLESYRQPGIELSLQVEIQDPATDCLAFHFHLFPFRDEKKAFMFFPLGSGPLLSNLNSMDCDVVFLQKAEYMCPESQKETFVYLNKILGGFLLAQQKKIFQFIEKLTARPTDQLMREIDSYCEHVLFLTLSPENRNPQFLLNLLNRPLRVCGVLSDKGGKYDKPFKTVSPTGEITWQFVEPGNIDFENPAQRKIYSECPVGNPVLFVCGRKNYRGELFALDHFAHPDLYSQVTRQHQGEPIKFLKPTELWAGGMAGWNTLFVELPEKIYFPVSDLRELKGEDS